MSKESRNIRLGLFVTISIAFLITALYFIGNKQNLFGSTFRIKAGFVNVNGLMKGNNVRFSGIDVGTVESVEIVNDSIVEVVMVLEKKIQSHIKKNAIASVGTDGLMGNKLVNIRSAGNKTESVSDGDILKTLHPVEVEEMVRTLNVTNENIKIITEDLKIITQKINSRNSLWNLLLDTLISENIKSSIVNIRLMSNQGIKITGDLKYLTGNIKSGKGSIGALITDTSLSGQIHQIVVKLNRLNDTTAVLSGNATEIIRNIKQGKGSLGILLNDTSLVTNLNKSMENLKNGSGKFDQNMEALKHTWPFKKYFKKKDKK
jgi:phospholipid/cholesterol/gamma-HCH transport system substrate-binding protein